LNTLFVFVSGWAGVAIIMLILWIVQWRSRNAGIVDVAWAFGTGVLGIWLVLTSAQADPQRKVLITAMAAIWSLRLGMHLASRVFSENEDGRYRYLREHLGQRVQPFMFLFFQVQALWAVMFALPMWAAAQSTVAGLGWLDIAGAAIFLISMIGEATADAQLGRFRRNPDNLGKVCRIGLWRYSRHPNYFFEWLHWWAYVLIGLGSPHWWVPLAGLVVVYLFLTMITGIPFTEQQALRSRGDAYRRYQQTTSAFFPWPPSTKQESRA
jgi:steroid 5-alpha reductase family enzyme